MTGAGAQVSPWTAVARACWHEDPAIAEIRTLYALSHVAQCVLDHAVMATREHLATYEVWHAGRLSWVGLTESLTDHLRDSIPMPVDVALETLGDMP